MKKKITAILSVIIALMLIFCVFVPATSAATNSITYNWQGRNAYDAGFAQGTITVSADSSSGGTYYLYWADDSAALDGYYPICKLNVAGNGSASYTMGENTAIPAKATRVLAFKSSSEPSNRSVSAATMNYKLPTDKATYKTDSDLLYSFASYSDMHVCSNEEGSSSKYDFDEQHLADAFSVAANRNVDFIVTTGDHVNNQRADSKGGANPFYPEEWNTYLQILANSDYVNPIYEAIGNHELWCYDTEGDAQNKDWKTGSDYFRTVTGLDSTVATMNSGKAYFEITEPVTGDHFLFMALEGGFYTDRVDEFTTAQLDWLESKLNAYQNDGKNTFIMEHANFDKWGAGDLLDNPQYDLPLKEASCASTTRLKSILTNHKEAVLICGHTHFQFDLNLNYSNNNMTSATIIHNSSVGATRNIVNGKRDDYSTRSNDEGYIVEVYKDATIFYGANLCDNRIMPSATYLVPQRTSAINQPTEAPTDPPVPTEAPTDPPVPTEAPTEAPDPIIYGDADDDGDVSSIDVTYIQRYNVDIPTPTPINLIAADVDADEEVTIIDGTLIQRFIVGIIDVFPAEQYASTGADDEIAAVGADIEIEEEGADLRTQAKNALDHYWLLASYDQYQALKKAYKQNADNDTLSAAYSNLTAAVNNFYSGDYVDIYFSNNVNWSNVYAYCSAGHGKLKNANWPGQKMDYVSTNSYGEKIYKISVPTATYNFIIFNNGSGAQTVDLPLGITKNQGFYYDSGLGTDSRGYYRCSSYVYH